MTIRSLLGTTMPILVVAGMAGTLLQGPHAGFRGVDRGIDRVDAGASPIDARCRIDGWTALEPLGDHEHAAVFAASARCSADGPSLRGAVATVELLWDADARSVTWHGADWNTDAGIVVMPTAEARLVPIAVADGPPRWEARFAGRFASGSAPPAAGLPYVMVARLEAPTRPPVVASEP